MIRVQLSSFRNSFRIVSQLLTKNTKTRIETSQKQQANVVFRLKNLNFYSAKVWNHGQKVAHFSLLKRKSREFSWDRLDYTGTFPQVYYIKITDFWSKWSIYDLAVTLSLTPCLKFWTHSFYIGLLEFQTNPILTFLTFTAYRGENSVSNVKSPVVHRRQKRFNVGGC